jgi:imidazolonepropionase
MCSLLIRNIGQLVQVRESAPKLVKGADMALLPVIDNAWLRIRNGLIDSFGTMDDCPEKAGEIIDAAGGSVFPAWCDSHTHLVFAGSREGEFVDKLKGRSYEEIAASGGGILNSARLLQHTSEAELVTQAQKRIDEIVSYGTGAVEIKSGYGLTVDDELKMLRVIRTLKQNNPLLTIKSTFLGAHALPKEYAANRQSYIRLIIDEMLPQIAAEHLADYCDVFCDKGFFTPEETATILSKANALGIRPKIHANELDFSGGIQTGVLHNALSVDHLEYTGSDEIEVLLNSDTMPTLLPSTAFFLRLKQPPAREMIAAGLPIALATDFNPGSSPSGRMQFILSLACINLRMTPEEAINAATINSAYAMGLSNSHGSITVGKAGSIFITKPIPSYAYLPYAFGTNLVDKVVLSGYVV